MQSYGGGRLPQKYCPPKLSWQLRRSRLESILQENRDKKLMLIIGQAAQGKSTLVSSYVSNSSEPVAWVNIDPSDADPINLFLSLVNAAQGIYGPDEAGRLSELPATVKGPRAPGPMYREWASAFYQALPAKCQLIVDGLDQMGTEPVSNQLLEAFLHETPESLRWIWLSRANPPVDLEKLKMSGAALVINNFDLAFTLGEAQALYRKFHGPDFHAEALESVVGLTEGWVGGLMIMTRNLNLAVEFLKNFSNGSTPPGQFKEQVFHFFHNQVFKALPDDFQYFLIVSSILDTVDPQLSGSLTGLDNSQEILEDLARQNLFVSRHYGDGQTWYYRYHLLFSEFLQAKLKAGFSISGRKEFFRRAADLYKKRDDFEKAIRLYLKAEDYPQAGKLLGGFGMEYVKTGRLGDLAGLLRNLPRELTANEPWLLVYQSVVERFTSSLTNFERLEKARQKFESQGDRRGLLLATAYLIDAHVICGAYDHTTIQNGLKLAAEKDSAQYAFENASLWHQIGHMESLRGDLRIGATACRNAIHMARHLKNNTLVANSLTNALTALTFLGEFHEVDSLCREIEDLLRQRFDPELNCFYLFELVLVHVFKGDIDQALATAERAIEEVEKTGLYYLQGPVRFYQLIALVYSKRPEEMNRAAESLLKELSLTSNQFMETVVKLFWGIGLYHANLLEQARSAIQEARGLFVSGVVSAKLHEQASHLIGNLITRRLDGHMELEELAGVHQCFQSMNSPLLIIQSHWILALGCKLTGDGKGLAHHLRSAFRLNAKWGYGHYILISPENTVDACILALELDDPEVREEAGRLMTVCFPETAKPKLLTLVENGNEGARAQARTLLRRIQSRQAPTIYIKVLGGFEVRLDGKILETESWGGTMAQKLLKVMVAMGPRSVNKEAMIDALWPEAAPAAAERNFKTALHRLRRTLEPDLNPDLGSTYVSLTQNTLNLSDLVDLDMERFERLMETIHLLPHDSPQVRVIAACEAAIQAYGGPFLFGDIHPVLVEQRRTELQEKYIKILWRKAEAHDSRGHYRKASDCLKLALQADSINEETCRRLMRLYAAYGRSNEAVKVYMDLYKTLQDQFDVEPEKLTKSVIEKIKETSSGN